GGAGATSDVPPAAIRGGRVDRSTRGRVSARDQGLKERPFRTRPQGSCLVSATVKEPSRKCDENVPYPKMRGVFRSDELSAQAMSGVSHRHGTVTAARPPPAQANDNEVDIGLTEPGVFGRIAPWGGLHPPAARWPVLRPAVVAKVDEPAATRATSN